MESIAKPKGYSIHIGLNEFDESYYGYKGILKACEHDAKAMLDIARSHAYTDSKLLLTQNATRAKLIQALDHARAHLTSGDMLLISYSGHGVQEMDFIGEEDDNKNEAWCLYDGIFLDDEVYHHLSKFPEGIRVLIISDSCHSGSMSKDQIDPMAEKRAKSLTKEAKELLVKEGKFKQAQTFNQKSAEVEELHIPVKLLAACQDYEKAYEGDNHGQFTEALLKVYANGEYAGDYLDFFEAIRLELTKYSANQNPNYYEIGPQDHAFDKQKPFEIVSELQERGFSGTSQSYSSYFPFWPHPNESSPTSFVWHLDDDHSQLLAAREKVKAERERLSIRIGIIDTGYHKDHPALPKNLLDGKNFVLGEEPSLPYDINNKIPFEQEGHGTATMAILAGGVINKEQSDGQFFGEFGAIPWAEVLPLRISDGVVLLRVMYNSTALARAIDYAVDQGCEVISISMGGVVSKLVAKAINRAYEAGVVVVSAAGNNWHRGIAGISPKTILFPARFKRVIAACGVTYNQEPYNVQANSWSKQRVRNKKQIMQGNWGPEVRMGTSLAAYTPNTSWGTSNQEKPFRLTGGGTSSSTPQIAAAAALWIVYHRQFLEERGYVGTWKQVAAVHYALFQSANKDHPEFEKYYGNGRLRALDALSFTPEEKDLHFLDEASISFPWLTSIIAGRDQIPGEEDEALMEELLGLIYEDPNLVSLTEKDLESIEDPFGKELDMISIANTIIENEVGSDELRARLMLLLMD